MTTLEDNLHRVRARLQQACDAAGRSINEVTLLAVSKTFEADAVCQAYAAGQQAFGENYVQEGIEKIEQVRAMGTCPGIAWHCIGPLQSNKTRLVAEQFDWVQSVDRLKIAQRLNEQRPTHLPPLQVCIQVNVDGGANKSGVAPGEALALARAVADLPRLRLRGLMAIPEPAPDFDTQRALFLRAKAVFDELRANGLNLDTLSLGMSDDLEAAVAAGSTMVRIGRAVFGHRERKVASV
jgi:pyridoxal phosphate enzyme (YggS family)